MTAKRAAAPLRVARTCAPAAFAGILALSVLGVGVAPAGAASASSVSDLQTQAQELAGQIQAANQTLDQLDENYNAAQIAYSRLQARQSQLAQEIAATAVQVAAARQTLKNEAVQAYLTGGAPVIQGTSQLGDHSDLTLAYAAIVTGGEKANIDHYQATLATQAHQQSAMATTMKDETVTLADIAGVRAQATRTLASQQAALAQVKGQLAVAVAAVQAKQQAAIQARVNPAPAASSAAAPQATSAAPAPAASSAPTARPTTAAPQVTPTTSPSRPAPTTTPPTTAPARTPPPSPSGSSANQAPGVNAVLAYARAQIGKPYQWGGAGPDSFDCSGLVMMAWDQAGIYFPHLAQDQYNLTTRIPLSAMVPGDLVFYGTPDNVYHVGIYIGNSNMIDAPETGQNVQVQNIYWSGLLGAGRVTVNS